MMYKLDDPLASRPFRLGSFSPWVTTELADKLFFGKTVLESPVVMNASTGGQATDFLWTTFMPLLCVSDRVVCLLKENSITGWNTFSVEVYDRKKNLLPRYHGFSVTGPRCNRDRLRAQVIKKPAPAPGGQPYEVYKGLYFDEIQWDGSDIFLVYAYRIIVSERVWALFKKEKISNIQLIPLSEVELPILVDIAEPY